MNLNFITWDVSPIAFQFGATELRWYGLMFPVAFTLGYFLGRKMFKREGVSLELVDTLFILIFISGMLGARLAHVFFYDWAFFREHPSEILKTWHGGLASHGGVVGVMLALFIWSKATGKTSFLWVMDKVAVCAAPLAGLIRIGNLMNSEIYGTATNLPWGFIFVFNGETIAKHPTQIYEAICYFIVFGILYFQFFKRKAYLREGFLSGLFAVMVFSARFLIEFIKNDQSAFEAGMRLNMGQWLSVPLILYGVWLVRRSRKAD